MRALLLLLLALPVQAARVGRAPAPRLAVPTLGATAASAPALSVPSLAPSAPVLTPTVQLQQLSRSVAPEAKQAPEVSLASAFDGGKPAASDKGAVAVSEVASAHANLAAAESRAHAARFAKPAVERSWRTRAWEAAELAVYSIPFHAASGWATAGEWSPAFQAAIWAAGGYVLMTRLADLRSTVVGGWQASHDQKYRVGIDGQLRDVRGHKYGEDRYEEYAPGAVSRKERLVIAAFAASSAVLWTLLGLN